MPLPYLLDFTNTPGTRIEDFVASANHAEADGTGKTGREDVEKRFSGKIFIAQLAGSAAIAGFSG
jgi:hypothetical protein